MNSNPGALHEFHSPPFLAVLWKYETETLQEPRQHQSPTPKASILHQLSTETKRDEICMNRFLGKRVSLPAGPSQPSSSRPLCWATLQVQLPQNFAAVTESCLKGDSSRGGRTPLLPFQVPSPKPGWLSRAVLILTHPKMSLILTAASICHEAP